MTEDHLEFRNLTYYRTRPPSAASSRLFLLAGVILFALIFWLGPTSSLAHADGSNPGPTRLAHTKNPLPVVVLWEMQPDGRVVTSWPYGLRFVAYDDGRIIYSPDPVESQDWLGSRYVLHYFNEQIDPTIVKGLGKSIFARVKAVQQVAVSVDDVRRFGKTILQVRDDETNTFERFTLLGHPCRVAGQTSLRPQATFFRLMTDDRLVIVCDELSQYQSGAAKPWRPDKLQIVLERSSESIRRIQWPGDWPNPESAEATSGKTWFCIPINETSTVVSDVTRALTSDDLDLRSGVEGIRSRTSTWLSPEAKYVLPDGVWPLQYTEPGKVPPRTCPAN